MLCASADTEVAATVFLKTTTYRLGIAWPATAAGAFTDIVSVGAWESLQAAIARTRGRRANFLSMLPPAGRRVRGNVSHVTIPLKNNNPAETLRETSAGVGGHCRVPP